MKRKTAKSVYHAACSLFACLLLCLATYDKLPSETHHPSIHCSEGEKSRTPESVRGSQRKTQKDICTVSEKDAVASRQ